MPTKIIEQQVQKTDLLDLELKSSYGALVKAVINLRSSHGNVSRGVDDAKIRQKIREIVNQLVR